jgi:hypothetical protein
VIEYDGHDSLLNYEHPQLKGLVGFWPLDGRPHDLLRGQNGTWNGSSIVRYKSRDAGLGLAGDFTRANSDYVDCGNAIDLSAERTIAFWQSMDDHTSVQTPISDYNSAGNKTQIDLRYGHIDNAWRVFQSGWYQTTGTIPSTPAWHHFAMTWSGTTGNWTLKFYIDGLWDSTHSVSANQTTGPYGNLAIGRAGDFNGNYVDGRLADVRLYNRPLSAAEIGQIYLKGSDVFRREFIPVITAGAAPTITQTNPIALGMNF